MKKRQEKFSINLQNFKKIKEINSGSFGNIYLVQDEKGQNYAAKVIKSTEYEDDKKMINREISILLGIQHQTIIKFHGYSLKDFEGNDYVTLLLDYAENGSLADYLKKVRRGKVCNLDNTAKQKILVGVACAMMYLHKHNVIHRDLKPGNILLDENLKPLVSDFGLSRFYSDEASKSKTGCVGTISYMAPEVMTDTKYDIKADVYSFGILMYEIITDSIPYQNEKPFTLMNKIKYENLRPQFNVQLKESLQLLIEQCWSSDPKDRPTFDEIFYKLAYNGEDPVYNVFESEEETPAKYYLDDVDKNELLSYVNDIIDDNIILQIQIKKLKDQIQNMEEKTNQIDTLNGRVRQLEEDNHQKDHIINLLNERLQNAVIYKERVIAYDPERNNAFEGINKHLTDVYGGNIHDRGIVYAHMPTIYANNLAKNAVDVQNETNYAQSDNFEKSFLCLDYGDLRVRPTHYMIRSRHDGNQKQNNHLQSWVIEGSCTGSGWIELDRREGIDYLNDVNAYHTFDITNRVENDTGFRYLKLTQIGLNTSGFNYLTISALEFFGSLFELK